MYMVGTFLVVAMDAAWRRIVMKRPGVYHGLKDKWGIKDVDKSKLSADDRREYEMWLRAKEEVASVDPDAGENNYQSKELLERCQGGWFNI